MSGIINDLAQQLWGERLEHRRDRDRGGFCSRCMGRAPCWMWKKGRSAQKDSGCGPGGFSVLEESHVVGESGQLLLVWNQ